MIRPEREFSKSLADIAKFVGVDTPVSETRITGITQDSRSVHEADLYIALSGFHKHGASYAMSALADGAAAILTDPSGMALLGGVYAPILVVPELRSIVGGFASWFYDLPSRHMNVVGITGTNGKTTTSHLIDSVWRSVNRQTGLIGTIETRIIDHAFASARTTPEATDLQPLFATMLERGCTDVVMEVSSHALSLGRVNGSHFAVSVFTNLTQDHLDFHASMDEYFRAKALLFTPEFSDLAIINVDDEYGVALARECRLPSKTFSVNGTPSDWYVSEITRTTSGSKFKIRTEQFAEIKAEIPLIGDHNIANALAALIVLGETGVDLEDALASLATASGVPGRLERVEHGQPFTAIVDYAHTPDAVERMLTALRQHTAHRIIGVLGCGGDRDPSKRPLMGSAIARGADIAILTSDNPRSEDPYEILVQMSRGAHGVEGAEVHVEVDRASAIALAVELAQSGDIVVVAGKGHEQGQEISGVVKPFDDREVLAQAIQRRQDSSSL